MSLRWGFLGAARIARNVLAPAVQAAGQEIVAVAARDRVRAQEFADRFAIPRAYEGYDALLADGGIDAVYVALPNHLHLPWTLRALAAGKHVLCEKPLGLDAGEVAQIETAAARAGLLALEAYVHVHHPQMARVREMLAGGVLGRLVSMQASIANPLLNDWDFRWTRAMGGGAMLDLGCYPLSAMRFLSGLEPVRVAATASMRGDVDAGMAATLVFGEGVAAQLACSFEAVRSQHLTLLGTAGVLAMDWPFSTRDRVTTVTLNGAAERFGPADAYAAMVRHFTAAATEEVAPLFPLSDSRRQARAHDALLAAAASARWVDVA